MTVTGTIIIDSWSVCQICWRYKFCWEAF